MTDHADGLFDSDPFAPILHKRYSGPDWWPGPQSSTRIAARTPDPAAKGVDAFSFDWQLEAAPYANPPWPLIARMLDKIIYDCVRCMVVVPN